jgi:hypothetical protein
MWFIATTVVQTRLRTQLNTMLFAKTLVRKDIVFSSGAPLSAEKNDKNTDGKSKDEDEEEN